MGGAACIDELHLQCECLITYFIHQPKYLKYLYRRVRLSTIFSIYISGNWFWYDFYWVHFLQSAEPALPTVDLTDETPTSPAAQKQRPGLPYRCDLCPATYPNAPGLNRHRQTYHKTQAGMCELGIPLVNMKNPGAMQKLASLGIFNYVPLPASGADGKLEHLTVLSTKLFRWNLIFDSLL